MLGRPLALVPSRPLDVASWEARTGGRAPELVAELASWEACRRPDLACRALVLAPPLASLFAERERVLGCEVLSGRLLQD